MKLIFEEGGSTGMGLCLKCPVCESEALHHDSVEIFDRPEDKGYCLHIVVDRGKAVMDTSLEGNPSPRRHGLVIGFYCEPYQHRTFLTIIQHKGMTYFDIKPASASYQRRHKASK